MQQQNPFQLLPLELKMPGQESRCHHRQARIRRSQPHAVSGLRQCLSSRPSICPAKGHSRKEQRNREVHQHHVLRVLCQQHRSGVKDFRDARHCTTTLPVIFGCTEQKYPYVPGFVNVNENFSSVSSTFDLNTLSSLTTVCGMSSRFVHVTVVPAATVSVAGPKLKLSIFTSTFDACACSALAVKPLALLISSTPAATTGAAKTSIHTRLLMTFLPFSVFQLNSSRDALPAFKPAKSPPPRGPPPTEQ